MRVRGTGYGMIAIFGYFLGVTIPGAIFMTRKAGPAHDANNNLVTATKELNSATAAYDTSLANLIAANQSMVDAGCFINTYSDFLNELNPICNFSAPSANSLDTLREYFGLDIETERDTTVYSSRPSTDGDCYTYGGSCIFNDGEYQIATVTISLRGTMLEGPGVQIYTNCGKDSQVFTINSQTNEQSSGPHKTGSLQETTTNIYTSKLFIKTSNVNNPYVEYAINPGNTDFEYMASLLLQLIHSTCQNFSAAMQTPDHYQNIIAAANLSLPDLYAEIDRTANLYNIAKNYTEYKQAIFDEVNGNYQNTLATWLTIIFVPTVLGILALRCYIEHSQNSKQNLHNLRNNENRVVDQKQIMSVTRSAYPDPTNQATGLYFQQSQDRPEYLNQESGAPGTRLVNQEPGQNTTGTRLVMI